MKKIEEYNFAKVKSFFSKRNSKRDFADFLGVDQSKVTRWMNQLDNGGGALASKALIMMYISQKELEYNIRVKALKEVSEWLPSELKNDFMATFNPRELELKAGYVFYHKKDGVCRVVQNNHVKMLYVKKLGSFPRYLDLNDVDIQKTIKLQSEV